LTHLGQACKFPEPVLLCLGIFEALFDLYALVRQNSRSQSIRWPSGRKEGLVSSTFNVIDILTDDPPLIRVEGLFTKDLIGVLKTIQNEST
jgi:hypothetical protein